jgi:hypothetical protein
VSKFTHEPLQPKTDWMGELKDQVTVTNNTFSELPDYVKRDPMFPSSTDSTVLIRCRNAATGEPLHVVLISSVDGRDWFCWLIEHQRFEIMETDFESGTL